MRASSTAAAFAVLLFAALPHLQAQSTPQPITPDNRPGYGSRSKSDPETGFPLAAMQEKVEKSRQSERQKRLVADTDRLLALANELKADMDKTNKDQLSIEVIKKAEEIEKLAKSVKDRMKG